MATEKEFAAAIAIQRLLERRPDLTAKLEWEQAHAIGVSAAEWSRLKSGARSGTRNARLTFRILMLLCRGFNVDLPAFLRLGGMPEEEVTALLPYLHGKGVGPPPQKALREAKGRRNGGRAGRASASPRVREHHQVRTITVQSPKPKSPFVGYPVYILSEEGQDNGGRLLRTVEGPAPDGGRRKAPVVPAKP